MSFCTGYKNYTKVKEKNNFDIDTFHFFFTFYYILETFSVFENKSYSEFILIH